MKHFLLRFLTLFYLLFMGFVDLSAQTNPVIISWLQNLSGIRGRHYVSGNPTPINDADSANVQQVFYSSNWAYVRTKGIPAYITGPFLDGNPSIATNQNAIFRFPLNPTPNTSGTFTTTTGGNIGVFINGVALFDYRDGVSWRSATNSLCGGPIFPPCMGDGVWTRDAVVAEKLGFDCSKGHPAMGNYHHHQNPSAFKLDLNVISNICNIYNADGLYAIDSTRHSPLIGFAYDGYPIYGAYAYKNANGTGGIVRMKSSYRLRSITTRTTYANGTAVLAGPVVSTTYPLGYFREDYQYVPTSVATPDFLDEHNGRFCVTPEYPSGTYCYFATVDANWNSAYPYVVGPTFYGLRTASKVASIAEPVTPYISTLPVQLRDFTAVREGKTARLRWNTVSEQNALRFSIERSEDGWRYQAIGTVQARGNSGDPSSYAFLDLSPVEGWNHYRLRQIDLDGKESLSPVASLSFAAEGSLSVFPNPSADFLVVQMPHLVRSEMHVRLCDIQGRTLLRNIIYPGSTICILETATLYNGQYVLLVEGAGFRESKKISIFH